jgi:hypothetical protein
MVGRSLSWKAQPARVIPKPAPTTLKPAACKNVLRFIVMLASLINLFSLTLCSRQPFCSPKYLLTSASRRPPACLPHHLFSRRLVITLLEPHPPLSLAKSLTPALACSHALSSSASTSPFPHHSLFLLTFTLVHAPFLVSKFSLRATIKLTLLRGFNPRRRNFARASGWIVNDVGGQIGRIGL